MNDNHSISNKEKIEKEIKEKTLGYIIAALGLVAGLAWNEAISSLIGYFFPASGNSLLAKFVYAFAITIVIVLLTIVLTKLFRKDDGNLK